MVEAQQTLKEDIGQAKVYAIRNKHYRAQGTKSYVYLMSRFGFAPTKPGPYSYVKRLRQRGLAGSSVAVGGRARIEREFTKKAGPEQTGRVTADDQQNESMYLCEVHIGTPLQAMMLDFDTGSSDSWVFSTGLGEDLQQGHRIYDPKKSSTFREASNKTWKVEYGDGSSASGDVGTDILDIGGCKIENQAIEMARELDPQFSQSTGDGRLGLAFPQLNTIMADGAADPQDTPVVNMIKDGDISKDAKLFTSAFYSERDPDAKSFYTFGYIDEDLVKASGENIHWADIDSRQGFWMFPSTSVTIDGMEMMLPGNTAIADTGTALALVSDGVCEALYSKIPGARYDETQQGYVFPASITADQLPHFSIAVGSKQYRFQKADLAFAQADGGQWYGAVQSRGKNPFDILGDAWLRSIYAIWDQGNKRFGIVSKMDKTQKLGSAGN